MSAVSFRISRPPAAGSAGGSSSRTASYSRNNNGSSSKAYANRSDESDSDDESFGNTQRRKRGDESVTSIDGRGIRSQSNSGKAQAPLVIPAIPNKDFRRAALELRARKAGKQAFIPSASSMPGSGSEVATAKPRRPLSEEERAFLQSSSNVQRIGEGAAKAGITIRRVNASGQEAEPAGEEVEAEQPIASTSTTVAADTVSSISEQDVDALALKELLSANSESIAEPKVTIIPTEAVSEEEAFRLDMATRPESATMEDYESVPIEDFGMALLRGMSASLGKSGQKQRAKVEPYVPQSRTAMLGLGAKSREESLGDLGGAQFGKAAQKESKRDSMRFIPLQKVKKVDTQSLVHANGNGAQSALENGRTATVPETSTNGDSVREDRHRRRRRDSPEDEGDREGDSRRRRRTDEYDSFNRRRHDADRDSERRRDEHRSNRDGGRGIDRDDGRRRRERSEERRMERRRDRSRSRERSERRPEDRERRREIQV